MSQANLKLKYNEFQVTSVSSVYFRSPSSIVYLSNLLFVARVRYPNFTFVCILKTIRFKRQYNSTIYIIFCLILGTLRGNTLKLYYNNLILQILLSVIRLSVLKF